MMPLSTLSWLAAGIAAAAAVTLIYLARINYLLKGVPAEVRKLSGSRWTVKQLKEKYHELEKSPIDYSDKIPPRLARRYIVTGGNGKRPEPSLLPSPRSCFPRAIITSTHSTCSLLGLVGGFIVLQLLARGTPPENIRILDIREPERNDMSEGAAAKVDFIPTDITSATSVDAAFSKPWPSSSTSKLPLTVFHTAAVILASDRSEYLYDFPESVNVKGTRNVLAAARAAGAEGGGAAAGAAGGGRPGGAGGPGAGGRGGGGRGRGGRGGD